MLGYVGVFLYTLNYLASKKINEIILYYAFMWDILSLLGLLLLAMHSTIIPVELGVDYLFEIGMFFEVILFSLLLGYRIKEISEQKKNQQLMLIQQSKLASMGEMISIIAHQWRQPLSQINGRVLGLDMDYKKKRLTSERMEEHLLDIETITVDMSRTMDDFMNFFNTKKEIKKFELSSTIEDALRMLRMSHLQKVEISTKVSNITLHGYKSELIQAFLIVLNNGIEAHEGEEIFKIDIEVTKLLNDKVEINIRNNGPQISDEVFEQMFEPYFTTKHKSQGKGLGLYILKMIIENGMGGEVIAKNDKKGVLFTLCIPRVL